MKLNGTILLVIALVAIAGCKKREEILEGERFDVRVPLSETYPDAEGRTTVLEPIVNRAAPIKLGKPVHLGTWSHRNSSASHDMPHLALASELTLLWSANIGEGNNRKNRITTDPVIAAGRIFTMDSRSRVMAHSLVGAAIWVLDLTPPSDKPGEASGGGLALSDGVLYASTGFGEVTAIRPENGAVIWNQKLDAPISAAPTVHKDRVYVISRDNRAWALKTKNGRVDWQQQSAKAEVGLVGGASPAISGKDVVLPFSSGELVAALTRNGLRVWSVAVSGSRPGQARSAIGDISSDPVVSGGRIYAANQSGRMTAIAAKDGKRLWTANHGSYSPVLSMGGSVFLVSDEAKLVRLDASSGEAIWAVQLPAYQKEKTRKNSYVHFGPVMAGGRLLVASDDGELRSFDPVSGAQVSSVKIPSGAASSPAIVNGVLYVLSQKGQLHAFK